MRGHIRRGSFLFFSFIKLKNRDTKKSPLPEQGHKMKIPWAEVLADMLTGNPKGSRSYCPFIISNEREVARVVGAAVDMSITELRYFYERIESGEHPVEPLCDMFLFAFAVGYRAGARKK